ncbi:LacI family DNA-binding transcriptional regulator [Phyllobacterium sp. SB3]|uniref:LacI family DNA-binding transcriptional regulator n=1 Tax=Phyllobacterium sp. SB3 TaxID=3156073 RepID=UPI0032AF0EE6
MTDRATSVDVARAAGVSQSTVSRALSDDKRISEETKKKIRKAAERLGYTPNEIARSLQTNKTNMIGLIMADIQNPFYPTVLEVYTQKLHSMGKRLLLLSVPRGFEVDDVLPSMLQHQVDGLVVTSAVVSSKLHKILKVHKTRTVLLNRSVDDFSLNSVCCENTTASIEVASFLVREGHRRMALIGGRPDTSTHRERHQGFQSELNRHGLDIVDEEYGGNTYEGGYQAALRLFSKDIPPDAIFCISDVMALGALDALRYELKLRVPEDVSIVGFDDIPAASWPSYNLTTVRQPVEAMVGRSLAILFDPEDYPPVSIKVPGELIIRGSVKTGAT